MRKINKIIGIFAVIILMLNIFSPINLAVPTTGNNEFVVDSQGLGAYLQGLLSISGGILLLPVKYQLLALAVGIQAVVSMCISAGASELAWVGIENIIFHNINTNSTSNIDALSIDFFGLNPSASTVTGTLSDNIAIWYSAIRTLAIIALLVVLVYIGIRMLLSSAAGSKSKYKEMLSDWLVSFGLLFVMHYIMIGVVAINNKIMQILWDANQVFNTSTALTTATDIGPIANILQLAQLPTIKGFLYAIIYMVLVIYAFIFLIIYLKRMFMLAFLTVIAPLVTITYSIDKVKDSKSQGLDTWIKEYVYNVLVQPFDALLYIVLVSFAMSLMDTNPILALVAIGSMLPLRQWVSTLMGLDRAKTAGNALSTLGAMWGFNQLSKGKGGGSSSGSSNKKQTKSTSNINKGAFKGTLASTGINVASSSSVGRGSSPLVTSGPTSYDSTSTNYASGNNQSPISKITDKWLGFNSKLGAPIAASALIIASGGDSKMTVPALNSALSFNKENGGTDQYITKKISGAKSAIKTNIDYIFEEPKRFEDINSQLREVVSNIESITGLNDNQKNRLQIVAKMATKGTDMPKDLSEVEQQLYSAISSVREYNVDNGWSSEDSAAFTAKNFNSILNEVASTNNLTKITVKD